MFHPSENSRHRVLIVDDDAELRQLYAAAFKMRGFKAHMATNGREAITSLNENGPYYCAMILDLNMPEVNGIEVAEYVKEHMPWLSVIVVSGSEGMLDRLRGSGLADLAQLVMIKPVDPITIATFVDNKCRPRPVATQQVPL